jgi:hypothetical protein
MWRPELIGMAAAIWPALFCLIAPARTNASNELRGTNSDGSDSPQAKSEAFLPEGMHLESQHAMRGK